MRNKLVLATMVSLALTGCKNDQLVLNGQDEKPPTETTPPTDIIPSITYTATLKAGLKALSGDVYCNGMQMSSGTFTVKQGESFSCTLGSVTLGDFTAPFPSSRAMRVANEIAETDFHLSTHATSVVQAISTCDSNPEQVCLSEWDALEIEVTFQVLNTEENSDVIEAAVNAFLATKSEESTDEVGKAPSSHNDDKVVPVVDPDAQSDLNSNFVSANAEASYGYKPSADAQVETISILTDANGTPIAGMSFFSANSVGVTDENGAFEYKWGDALTFGIDTFEFGTVTGNKIEYKLTDVSDNPVVKANIQSLLERYAEANANTLVITDTIQETFALYPNVINELINLSLPNGGTIEGTNFELPREFELQFEQGLTNVIDEQLRQPAMAFYARSLPTPISMDSGQYVTQSLKQIFAGVSTFHVFNDTRSFYGASGYTRGMRALNLSNRAFPVAMPRTDKNRELFYGEAQAWTREGRPYVAEWPGIENMPAIPLVNGDNATYGFPFVTAGEIGKGKVVFMGNVMYPSILSCPDNYWNNRSVAIDSQNKTCTSSQIENSNHTDNGSMKRFFANLFQWFNGNKATNG
ncbi:accessory colonization factor AcfD precursor [Vibrio ponticus]|nr:accessory colonization factor AcfD precursor [Vibrio ponticus]